MPKAPCFTGCGWRSGTRNKGIFLLLFFHFLFHPFGKRDFDMLKNIVVAGGGVLGSQIAYQVAYCGFNVTI